VKPRRAPSSLSLRRASYSAAAVLVCSSLISAGCFHAAPTEHITYDSNGKLALIELNNQRWPDLFRIIQRESGFQIQVPRMPSGTATMRLEHLNSWEEALDIIANTQDLAVTSNSERSFTLNPK
jgi:hypothetical protein